MINRMYTKPGRELETVIEWHTTRHERLLYCLKVEVTGMIYAEAKERSERTMVLEVIEQLDGGLE